jgi:prolyl-tRNA editing enzyme YbaK/EbsC (Cys-tRNA(Pro) deacylase)
MHLAVVNHVWKERTERGTLPFQASRGKLHQVAKTLVAEIGDEKAVAILMDVMDFTPGCVNYALHQVMGNGKVSKAEARSAANKARIAKIMED